MLRTSLLLSLATGLLISLTAQAQSTALLAPRAPTPMLASRPLANSSLNAAGPPRPKQPKNPSTGFQVGVRGGVNYLTFIKDKPDETFNQGWIGHGGLVLNTGGRVVSFQPEFIYDQTTIKTTDPDGTYKTTAGQLEVPLLAKISFGRPEATRFFVVLGPYAGYLLNGKTTITEAGQTVTVTHKLGKFEDRFSYGATAGLGLAIPAGPGWFTLEARGLLGLGTTQEFTTADSMVLQGSIGYLFSLGGR